MIADRVVTSYWFYRWRPQSHKSTSGFWFAHVLQLTRSKAVGIPNFDHISQSTAEILLLPVPENKRPSYWNSTSGFDFYLFTIIGIWFSIIVPNFIGIRSTAEELWRIFWYILRHKCWQQFWFSVGTSMSVMSPLCEGPTDTVRIMAGLDSCLYHIHGGTFDTKR